MWHRHNWNLIDKTVISPALDEMKGKMRTHSAVDTELVLDAMREKVVHVFKCECGKVKVCRN